MKEVFEMITDVIAVWSVLDQIYRPYIKVYKPPHQVKIKGVDI